MVFGALKRTSLAALAFGLCSLGTLPTQAEPLDVTNPQIVEAFVDGAVVQNMKTYHSPSGVVAVMKDGEVIFKKGYGFIDIEKQKPVDPDTSLFRPGSISKLFTWISVMQQVERGKLDLDTDVNTYLKTFKVADTYPGQPVTLRHIMTHTAGFEDGGLGYLIVEDPASVIPLADSLAKYQPARVNAPGEHTSYSNWATALAGLIVQNVSGVEFNTYVKDNIFDVLGMNSSTFEEPLPADLNANMAIRYNLAADTYKAQPYELVTNFGPAGAAAVTASDMIRFGRALLNGGELDGNRILKTETLDQMIHEGFSHDPRVRGMGLGFIKRQLGNEGFANFGHDGATTGFISHFGLSKKEDFMIFSSFSGPGARKVYTALTNGFYEEFFPEDLPYITPPADFADRAQKYVGTFNNYRNSFTKAEAFMRAFSGEKVVALPDNTLLIGEKRYVEIEKNLFRQVHGKTRVAFQEDADGNITSYVYDGFGVTQYYRAPFYETSSFTLLVLSFSLLMFLGVFLRLAYQWATYKAQPRPAKVAQTTALVVAGLNIAFWGLFCFAATGFESFIFSLPFSLKASFLFSTVATIVAFYQLYQTVLVWKNGLFKSVWARVRYSFVTLAALLMAWFYYFWNFFGFNYL